MKVRLLFFADLKERFGAESREEIPDGMRVGELASQRGLGGAGLLFAVNEEFSEPETVLKENDVVAFLRPMSGGSR